MENNAIKEYQGVKIIYEDNHILVAVKPQNMPSQEDESKDPDILSILKNYLKEAETGIVGNRKISWKQISKSSVDTKRLKTEKPDIYNDYLTQSQYRRLSVA